jgi:hypothetical protein
VRQYASRAADSVSVCRIVILLITKLHYCVTWASYWPIYSITWIQQCPHRFKIHFNIILASTPRYSKLLIFLSLFSYYGLLPWISHDSTCSQHFLLYTKFSVSGSAISTPGQRKYGGDLYKQIASFGSRFICVVCCCSQHIISSFFRSCMCVCVCLYVLLLILMVYRHSLDSKFVLLVGHFTKNILISVLFSFCLPMIILFRSTFITFRLCLLSPYGLRLQFPYKAHLCLSSPSDACHLFARLNRLHLISLPVFTEKHKTSYCLFQPPVYSSLCRPNVSLSTIFSSHLSLWRPLPPSLSFSFTHTHTHTHTQFTNSVDFDKL